MRRQWQITADVSSGTDNIAADERDGTRMRDREERCLPGCSIMRAAPKIEQNCRGAYYEGIFGMLKEKLPLRSESDSSPGDGAVIKASLQDVLTGARDEGAQAVLNRRKMQLLVFAERVWSVSGIIPGSAGAPILEHGFMLQQPGRHRWSAALGFADDRLNISG